MGVFSNNPGYWRSGGGGRGSSSGGGVRIEVNSSGIELNIKHIESMLTDNPEMRQRIQEAIKKDVWAARKTVVANLASVFDNKDPNEARRAVRNVIYEKVLGANMNIYNMRRGTAQWKVKQKDRKVEQNPKMRGGNRIKRQFKTIRMEGYEGKARGMILRWVDSGVGDRETKYGARGNIAPRHFFKPIVEAAFSVVSQHLAQIIEQEIENVFNQD